MSEPGKNDRKKPKWSPEEIRKLRTENPNDTKLQPYLKMRDSELFKCANIVFVRHNEDWVDSEVSFCLLCQPNTKVCINYFYDLKLLNLILGILSNY